MFKTHVSKNIDYWITSDGRETILFDIPSIVSQVGTCELRLGITTEYRLRQTTRTRSRATTNLVKQPFWLTGRTFSLNFRSNYSAYFVLFEILKNNKCATKFNGLFSCCLYYS